MKNEQAVTENIIRAIERGTADFIMPWHKSQVPINALTKKPYRGMNTLSLWASSINQGYESPEWATYQSWKSAERQVRKGEKGTKIFFFSRIKVEDEPEDEESPHIGFRKFYSVFNSDQLEANDETQTEYDSSVIENTHASEQVLSLAESVNAQVLIEGERAAYHPTQDCVVMPEKDKFFDTRYTSAD